MAAQWVDRMVRPRGRIRRFLRRVGIMLLGGVFAAALIAPAALAAPVAATAVPQQPQARSFPALASYSVPLAAESAYQEPALVRHTALRSRLEPRRADDLAATTSPKSPAPSRRRLNIIPARVVADASSFRAQASSAPPPAPARAEGEDPRYLLPVGDELVTNKLLTKPHHDYAAWDLGMPIGTEVYSVTAGHVTGVISGDRCGVGVQVVGVDGFTYLYCHGSETVARLGDEVEPGDLIMLSGNTGRSTGPHLHLQMRSPAGALVCPQDVLPAWAKGDDVSAAEAGQTGCFYASANHDHDETDGGDEDEKPATKSQKLQASIANAKKKNKTKSKGPTSAPPKPSAPTTTSPGPKPSPPSATPPVGTPSPTPSASPANEAGKSQEPQEIEEVATDSL